MPVAKLYLKCFRRLGLVAQSSFLGDVGFSQDGKLIQSVYRQSPVTINQKYIQRPLMQNHIQFTK